MNAKRLYDYFKVLEQENIVTSIRQKIDQNILKSIQKDVLSSLENISVNTRLVKKTYMVVVESIQNMYRHTFKDNNGVTVNETLFVLVKKNDSFKILVGNTIPKDKKADIELSLNYINNLDRETLKRKRKEILYSNTSNENSAGIGLFDIALKTNGPIEYEFIDYSDDKLFFSIELNV